MPEHRLFEYQGHYLVKRTDTPHYHIYWCRPGTRRVRRKSAHTADLEEAKQRLIEFVHERHRPRDGSPDTVSIHDALNEYIERNLAGKPSQSQARYALGHWDAFLERRDLMFVSDLTLDQQDAYIEWRRTSLIAAGHTGSNGTIARELAIMRAALREFWKRGLLDRAPYVKGLPPPPPRERFLQRDEVERLLAACQEPHLRLFVLISLHTLQRPGAVLELRVEQVDLARSRIDFLPHGKVQSHKRKAVVPITSALRPSLEAAVDSSTSGYVIEYRGDRVRSIRNSFSSACERGGLNDVSPYTIRRTGATLLAASGVPLRQIAGMMGHTDTVTTERHYAKHAPEFLQDAAASLDRMFGDRQPPALHVVAV